jgi:Golgi phosphoprotein 3 (GPP34)
VRLLAEDALLLFLDDTTGRLPSDRTPVPLALAAAHLCDLARLGRIGLSSPDGVVRAGRVVVLDSSASGDDALDAALAQVGSGKAARPEQQIAALAKGLLPAMLERLAGQGVVHCERRRVLGVLPRTTWPIVDSGRKADLLACLHGPLVLGTSADERMQALVSVFVGCGQARKLVAGDEYRAAKLNAKAMAARSWIATGLRKAIEAAGSAGA